VEALLNVAGDGCHAAHTAGRFRSLGPLKSRRRLWALAGYDSFAEG